MATELPRPGVQVIQEFQTTSPTIVIPTLVPFVTGPAQEIVEFTDSDGLINADAEQGDYAQLPQTIGQSAFPSPRGNIQEVDVDESTIRLSLLFGGTLSELDRDPGSAFLTSHNHSRRAGVQTLEITGAGLDLNGKVLVFALDNTAAADTTTDITVTFSGAGNLTPAQIATQINTAAGATVAVVVPSASDERVRILSATYGAASSVTIRAAGSANVTLGAVSAAVEYRVTGAGFYAEDQADNTTLSPYVKWSRGVYSEDGTAASFPAVDPAELYFGQFYVDTDGTDTWEASQAPDIDFSSAGIDLWVSDWFVADGTRPNSTAEVQKVEATRIKLGTINATLSTFDADGDVLTAVYDNSFVNTLAAGVPFAPKDAWFKARNIDEDDVDATAGTLTGSVTGAAATVGSHQGTGVSGPYTLTGLTLVTQVTVDGVEGDEETFTFTGGPWADMDAVVVSIGSNITGVVATDSSSPDGDLILSTANTGDDQILKLKATSTALSELGLTAGTYAGTDVEFLDISAVLTGGTQTFPFNEVTGETFIINGTDDGGATWTYFNRTFTSPSTDSAFANIAALIGWLNTGTSWDGGTLPTEFVITSSGDQVVITGADSGSLYGIQVDAASTAIGSTSNTDLLFTGDVYDIGEENLSGLIFKYRLNDRPVTYATTMISNSLLDAVDEINDTVGTTVASVGGAGSDQLVMTSFLDGQASRIEIIDDGTNNKALLAFGFTAGQSDYGSGRPDADFQVDGSGNVLLGGEILRSAVTGIPFAPGNADIYLQYTALRLDVSPQAATPGLLSISDTTTLGTVLNPVTADNPLGLAMYFQLINAPGVTCKGMGISDVTAAAPEGTSAAYTEVSEYIESEEVYAIAPLTHDETIFAILVTHVDYMSAAAQKGERILLCNPDVPSRAVNTVVDSGTSADTTATSNELVLDSNPEQALIDNGIDPSGPIDEDEDLFVEITVEQVLRRYNVSAVNGTLVTFRTSFSAEFNTDSYYTETDLTETLVNADWSMQIRGAELVIAGSSLPDKDLISETVAAQATAIDNRRVVRVFPDSIVASLSGTSEILDGYYACAAMTGMIANQQPQQGFTNLPMTGFTAVQGSNDTYSTSQLNVMAGGGAYVLVQDVEGGPVTSRHQLTTDLTSIESRELSITKVVDYVAKFMRTGLRNFIGTFNITQPFLDTLSTVIQGMLAFLEEGGVILGGDLNNLVQDTTNPDTVLIDVTLDIPYPCNYIRLTLVV
jgi:hypothetical protein